MNGYEKLIMTIRKEGARNNPPSLFIGEMTSKNECAIGSLSLDKGDLLFAEHLTKRVVSELDIKADDKGVSKTGTNDKCKYIEPLKKGDKVLLYKVGEEKYVVIERVVSL